MAMDKDKVLELIRNLLTKTVERGCTQEEAASAATKAQELLQKYHVEMAEVGTNDEKTAPDLGHTNLDVEGKGHDGLWKASLLHIIATCNFCDTVVVPARGKSILFGSKVDAEVVTLLFDWVVEQLERIAADMWKAYDGQDRRPTYRRSFFTAAVSIIYRRLHDQQKAFEKSSEKSTALVVVSKAQVTTYLHETIGDTREARSRGSNGSFSGSVAGMVAGQMVNIDKPHKRLATN